MEAAQFQMACPKCLGYSFTVRRDQRAYVHKSQPFELVFSCRCGKQLFGDQIQEEYDRQKAIWDQETRANPDLDEDAHEAQREEERRKEQLRRAMEYRRTYLAEKRRQQADEERRRKEEEDQRWREKVARVEAEEKGIAPPPVAPRPIPTRPTPRRPEVHRPEARPRPEPARRPVEARAPETPRPATEAPTRPAVEASTRPAPPPAAPDRKADTPSPAPAAPPHGDEEHPHAEFMPYLLDGSFAELFPEATPPDRKEATLCVWPPCEKTRRKKSKYCSRECSNKNARWRHKMRRRDGDEPDAD